MSSIMAKACIILILRGIIQSKPLQRFSIVIQKVVFTFVLRLRIFTDAATTVESSHPHKVLLSSLEPSNEKNYCIKLTCLHLQTLCHVLTTLKQTAFENLVGKRRILLTL